LYIIKETRLSCTLSKATPQQQIADEVGVSKPYVNKVLTKTSDSDNSVNTPGHLNNRNDKADYRKLPMKGKKTTSSAEVVFQPATIAAYRKIAASVTRGGSMSGTRRVSGKNSAKRQVGMLGMEMRA
jgi:hypothetical protein